MTTFVALLRAVNVGTTNRIAMAGLKQAFVDAGFADAVTHIQTGNVVFTATGSSASVQTEVEALILDQLGLSITAIIRTAAELAVIARSNPFAGAPATDAKQLHVGFLGAEPTTAAGEAFLAAPIGDDEVRLHGRQVFVRYAVGAGSTKLTAAVWNKLGVAVTARNWNVTTTLARLAAEHR